MAIRWEDVAEEAGHLASHLTRGTPEVSADVLPAPSSGATRIRWEPVSGLSPDALRDAQAQAEEFLPVLHPALAAAWRELTSPVRSLGNLIAGLPLGYAPREEQARQAGIFRENPLAYSAGSLAGSIPSFLLAGEATAPLKGLPILQRLMQMGRLGRAAATGIPLAAQFGLQASLQGAPEQAPRQALIGMLMGLVPGALRHPPTPTGLPELPAPPEQLQLPGPPTEASTAIPGEAMTVGYDPYGAFRTGEAPFPVESTVPRKYQVRPLDLGEKPIRRQPVGKTPVRGAAPATKVTRQSVSYPQVGDTVSYGSGEVKMKVISVDKATGLVEVYNPNLNEQVPVHISDIRSVVAEANPAPAEQRDIPKRPPRRPSKADLGMVGGSD